MKTKQIYYESPYLKELECTVLSVENKGNLSNVILDATIFYPEGGGQPSDRGKLGSAQVESVRMIEGEIIHQVRGNLSQNDEVKAELDWEYRLKYMRIHTAGHLLHDVLLAIYPDLVPVRASHGKKPFIEYTGIIPESEKETIEQKVNEVLKQDLPVVTKETSYEEIAAVCQFVPEHLPKNKPLRMIKIGEFAGMPDGGVHVASTRQIGKIWIAGITPDSGMTKVRYGIAEG